MLVTGFVNDTLGSHYLREYMKHLSAGTSVAKGPESDRSGREFKDWTGRRKLCEIKEQIVVP